MGGRSLTIEDMKETARERRGRCLSKEYVNNSTKLRWRCKDKHEWEATPGSVRNGHWCPICATRIRSKKQMAWWRRKATTQTGE